MRLRFEVTDHNGAIEEVVAENNQEAVVLAEMRGMEFPRVLSVLDLVGSEIEGETWH